MNRETGEKEGPLAIIAVEFHTHGESWPLYRHLRWLASCDELSLLFAEPWKLRFLFEFLYQDDHMQY